MSDSDSFSDTDSEKEGSNLWDIDEGPAVVPLKGHSLKNPSPVSRAVKLGSFSHDASNRDFALEPPTPQSQETPTRKSSSTSGVLFTDRQNRLNNTSSPSNLTIPAQAALQGTAGRNASQGTKKSKAKHSEAQPRSRFQDLKGSSGQSFFAKNFQSNNGGAERRENQHFGGARPREHQFKSKELAHTAHQFDVRKLYVWANQNPNPLLIFEVSNHLEGLQVWLYQNDVLQFEELKNLLLLLHNLMVCSSQEGSQSMILKSVTKARFFEKHVEAFFTELRNHPEHQNLHGWILKVADIIEETLEKVPGSKTACQHCLRFVKSLVAGQSQTGGVAEVSQRVDNLLKECQTASGRNQMLNSYRPSRLVYKIPPVHDEANPPDDFTTMNIFPDTEELLSSVEPFLRANKTRGTYRSVQHYLDIQSRLFKQDYVEPIRHGIQDYRSHLETGQKLLENNFRFYWNVNIVKMGFNSNEGATHFLSFDITEFENRNFDWETSKRLKYGSLVCLSKDGFQNTLLATVAEEDIENLKKGIVQVIFQDHLESVFTSSENDVFVMGETAAYFESYRHVLEGLIKMRAIPLDSYILYCDTEVSRPQYLHYNKGYDIASILTGKKGKHISVLNLNDWPSAQDTCLNEWQLEAVKHGLTKEMALIQGPPGTGKTYVGLHILRILLNSWEQKELGPVLVVCYTNHALDQFLEGVLQFSKRGIVRIGGRSGSEMLAPFNLKALRKGHKLKGPVGKQVATMQKKYETDLRRVSKLINRCWKACVSLETTIASANDLKTEMSSMHYTSLTETKRSVGGNTCVLSAWLKASSANMENHLLKAARRHLAKCIAKVQTISEWPDGHITSESVAIRMKFLERVKVYRWWIQKYRTDRELYGQQAPGFQMDALSQVEASKTDILDDESLVQYMTNDIVFESVKQGVKAMYKTEDFEHQFVRQWLLGSFVNADELLDAIEQLQKDSIEPHKKQASYRAPKVFDSAGRWEIQEDDSDGSDYSEDEDLVLDGSDEGRANATAILNYIESDLSEFQELEESFHDNENKDVLLLQRAKMLGVDLSDQSSEEEQWQTQNKMTYQKVFNLYHRAVAFTESEALSVHDLWSLTLPDRYRLYKYWVMKKREKMTNSIIDLVREYKLLREQEREARHYKDIEILKKKKVIGMTTTGAAKNRKVLQEVACKIILLEEAAEVLEAHVITTMSSSCQHLILIGDHQQLRPNPTVHRLAVDFGLEISMFERLIRNELPHITLQEQHRMRPEISHYMRFEYPHLIDHPRVREYPPVEGTSSNVFFLQHSQPESEVEDTFSKANLHEARFLLALCNYFLQHDYESSQITLLAAYSGQVNLIKSLAEEMTEEVKSVLVSSIDNYQGEENDIILLSLVRSNRDNQVGFLKTHNRVCVALSRAKIGLFVIGDFGMLEPKSPFWSDIMKKARRAHVTGTSLKLTCGKHGHISHIMNPEDFIKEVPEGGCYKDCLSRLKCDHICPRKCHPDDPFHDEFVCKQPCLKQCPEGHHCVKLCYDECGHCLVKVRKTIPSCGHVCDIECYLSPEEAICQKLCNIKMACGHLCRGACGQCRIDGYHAKCREKVEKEWPCKHSSLTECHVDVSVELCPQKCNEMLDCGHKCGGTCGQCLGGRLHIACTKTCKKSLPCGHECKGHCGTPCQPCGMYCLTKCRHGSCEKSTCGELCLLCVENCAMICNHRKCPDRCLDECQVPPCPKQCIKVIEKCRHKCVSLCGEMCVCRQCGMSKFSLIDFSPRKGPKHKVAHDQREKAKKFQITDTDTLMVIPGCGHVFTLRQLDKYVAQFDPDGTSYVKCPNCPTTLDTINRYDKQLKARAVKRENRKRELLKSREVQEAKLTSLKTSRARIGSFCVVDDGDYLKNKDNQIDKHHALSLSFQIKSAFALGCIHELHKEYNQKLDFAVVKCKHAIAAIGTRATPQLMREMKLELHRMLLLEEMAALNQIVKDAGVIAQKELKSQCKELFRDFNKSKLTPPGKQCLQDAVQKVYNLLQKPETSSYKEYITDIQSRAAQIRSVVDSADDQDLCEILPARRLTEVRHLPSPVPTDDEDTSSDTD